MQKVIYKMYVMLMYVFDLVQTVLKCKIETVTIVITIVVFNGNIFKMDKHLKKLAAINNLINFYFVL